MFWQIFSKKPPSGKTRTNISENASTAKSQPAESGQDRESVRLPMALLKKLMPIGQLSNAELGQLSIHVSHFPAGSIIFKIAATSNALIYLIEGNAYLEAGNGSGYEIAAGTLKALYPLSNGARHNMTAFARSAATVIYIPQEAMQLSNRLEGLLFTDEIGIPEKLQNNEFFLRFYHNFRKSNLEIPTLPNISIRLQQAMQKDPGISEIVKIVELDPVIAAKLIQVANSPFYRTANPITTCHGAINRLGLNTTRSLVTSISMRNLFHSSNKNINIRFQKLWEQSVKISVISCTLASLTRKADPGEALLAGLVHNIGALPLLKFASELPEDGYDSNDLDRCLRHAQGMIGTFILKKWDFPESLEKIPIICQNWYFDDSSEFNLADIIILAKFHSLMGSQAISMLPPINTLPAFLKLGNNALSADMSLQILHEAKQQISEAMSFFAV